MRAFIVEITNEPGQLALVTGTLAAAGVDIQTLAAIGIGTRGSLAIVPDREAETRAALAEAGIAATDMDLLEIPVADEPGSLAAVCSRLARAGVNIHLVLPLGVDRSVVTLGIAVDDPHAARAAVADLEPLLGME